MLPLKSRPSEYLKFTFTILKLLGLQSLLMAYLDQGRGPVLPHFWQSQKNKNISYSSSHYSGNIAFEVAPYITKSE